jgi:hypothetical protein
LLISVGTVANVGGVGMRGSSIVASCARNRD